MIDLWNNFLFNLFLKLGARFFPVVDVWNYTEEDGSVRVVYFALSERDLNTACRELVEVLDSNINNK